jgi:rhodanese-related sulfurtransferase
MKARKRIMLAAAALAAALSLFVAQRESPATLVTPTDASALIKRDSSVVILDVRTADEYYSGTGHLNKAILIPVQALEERLNALDQFKDRTILVYCRSGHRSTAAAEILQKHGFRVRNMEGGITQWNEQGLPVVKEQR